MTAYSSDRSDRSPFAGATVALFEARHRAELESLVRRHGGVPWSAPALTERAVDPGADGRAAIARLASGGFDAVVLLTGVGVRRLLEEAARLGVLDGTLGALGSAEVICRGPKPSAVLKGHNVRATRVVPEPNTTTQVLEELGVDSLAGESVLVVSAGERADEPSAFLRRRGADPVEIQLYEWALAPSDVPRLAEAVAGLIEGRFHIAAFTTQVQVRHLFEVARASGDEARLASALSATVLVGAVGPTCAAALRARGVEPHVVPEHPKMGHLVVALARAVAAGRAKSASSH